jgi:hypothetical protein
MLSLTPTNRKIDSEQCQSRLVTPMEIPVTRTRQIHALYLLVGVLYQSTVNSAAHEIIYPNKIHNPHIEGK